MCIRFLVFLPLSLGALPCSLPLVQGLRKCLRDALDIIRPDLHRIPGEGVVGGWPEAPAPPSEKQGCGLRVRPRD